MTYQDEKASWHSPPVEWLLEGRAYVGYRTLVDLLGLGENHPEVRRVRAKISEDEGIDRILAQRNRGGYWGTSEDIFKWWPRKDTTFWVLGMLADFGLRKDDHDLGLACEYVFSTQLPNGAFGLRPPPTAYDCYTGILAESLARLGYIDDERLGLAYDWLIGRQRLDGGFWCKNTGQPGRPREAEPSCAFGTLCVLGALAVHPEMKDSEVARKSAAFLLECWDCRGTIKYAGHDSQIGTGWEKLKYPFTDYRILKYLDALSLLSFIRADRRLPEITDLLISKQDPDGRLKPESIHKVWSDFDFGQKKHPSRWITLCAHRILKRLGSEP